MRSALYCVTVATRFRGMGILPMRARTERSWRVLLSVFILAALSATTALAAEWSEPQTILRGRDKVVTYRATVENGWLLVEVKHEPGWHTYAMDNLRRAQEKTGKENPSTELNTVIEIAEGGELAGKWHQSEPKDLSTPEIRWYTWGFEKTAYFAAPVKTTAGTLRIVINAQSCNESACSMVEDLELSMAIAATTEPGKDAPRPNLIPVQISAQN